MEVLKTGSAPDTNLDCGQIETVSICPSLHFVVKVAELPKSPTESHSVAVSRTDKNHFETFSHAKIKEERGPFFGLAFVRSFDLGSKV